MTGEKIIDSIARLDERLKNIELQLSNHLHFHSRLNIAFLTIAASSILNLIITLIK